MTVPVTNLSIILPVIDETNSLRETVEILLNENLEFIGELLIVVCGRTTPRARGACLKLEHDYPSMVRVREQRRPFLGGAMQDAFEWATGSHIVMMASDLETDPGVVAAMIARAREGADIVNATRWSRSSDFPGCGRFKRASHSVFQKSFGLLYHTPLTDLTYGFRLFKAEWVKNIEWEELRHPFLLETILKPLRLGARVVEVPVTWTARTEGESHRSFRDKFGYFPIALRTLARNRNRLLKAAPHGLQPVREALDQT